MPDDPGGSGAPVEPGAWIDSHCHLQERYRPDAVDVRAALTEAGHAGVSGLVCIGTDASTSAQALALARLAAARDGRDRALCEGASDPGVAVWATMGLHPHEASAGTEEVERLLEAAVVSDPALVVGVGECGLDYHYEHSPRADQRLAFARQIALARRLALTLVVHTREAWDDTLDLLASDGVPARTVVHCFTGGPDEARRCLDLGAYLSFSGIVTFKNASEVREAARLCPEERLLVETDAPFLAPVPYRGQPNRPAWVVAVGAALAEVRGVAVEELARSTAAATRAAFGLR